MQRPLVDRKHTLTHPHAHSMPPGAPRTSIVATMILVQSHFEV